MPDPASHGEIIGMDEYPVAVAKGFVAYFATLHGVNLRVLNEKKQYAGSSSLL